MLQYGTNLILGVVFFFFSIKNETDKSIPSLSKKIYSPKNILRHEILIQDKLSLIEHNIIV